MTVFFLLVASFIRPSQSLANDLVFGPETCQRGTGAPTVFNYSFSVAEPTRGFIFKVYNGGLEDTTYELVSSSTISLNGTQILGPNNFNQNVSYLEVPVTLQAHNTLSVEVRGKPGGALVIKVFPFVVIDTPTLGQAFSATSVSVMGHLYSEASGIDVNGISGTVTGTTFAVSGNPLVEGSNVLTATAVRSGGFTGQAAVTVTRDTTPPAITLISPHDGVVVTTPTIDIVGSVNDPSAVVLVNGSVVALAGTSFAANGISLTIGLNTIPIEARDPLGNHSSMDLQVAYTPPVPTTTLTAAPSQIQIGAGSTLQWTTSGATAVSISPGIGAVAVGGSLTVTPTATTTYILTATGPGGTATAETTVTVNPAGVHAELAASSDTISLGGSATLSWLTQQATQVVIEPSVGAVQTVGSITVSPSSTTRYTITAVGTQGVATAAVLVRVEGSVATLPEGSFGAGYQDLVPADATVAAYDSKRFAVVTGLVQDQNHLPLAGVPVSVHDKPQYGTVVTDADGRFSLPVEGGGLVRLLYRKDGLLTVHRDVVVKWNEVAAVDTVEMIPQDPLVTTIALDGNPRSMFVHSGSMVMDESGSRSATVVITGDTHAYARTDAGEVEITRFDLRATEFASASAMPAELPPTSAYTYCVDLSASGWRTFGFPSR